MKKETKKKVNIILAAVIIIISFVLPLIIKNDYYMMVLNRVLINIVVVLGLNFITGLTGQMNLGTAGIFALGAYSSALFTRYTNLSPWLGLAAAVLIGVIIGRGLGYPSLRIKGVYLSLTTIGFSEVVRLLISNMTKITGGTQGIRDIVPYSIFGYQFKTQNSMYYLFLMFVFLAFFIAWRIAHSKWGRIFKSLRDNVEAVEMSGVDVSSCKIKAFTIASIFGTVGGAMYAHYMGYINPSSFNLDLSTNFVVMLMVGGLGSVIGNLFGAGIVTILPELLRFSGDYYQIVFCTIILLGAIFFPNGWLDAVLSLFRKLFGKNYKISLGNGGGTHE